MLRGGNRLTARVFAVSVRIRAAIPAEVVLLTPSVSGVAFPPDFEGRRRFSFSLTKRESPSPQNMCRAQVIEWKKNSLQKEARGRPLSMSHARFPRIPEIPRILNPANRWQPAQRKR